MLDRPRIEIRGRIGEGAAAEVFDGRLSFDNGVTRRVAIKRLRSGARKDIESFADEARILRHLGHAGIVGVLDYGLLDGRPMLVMEHVDGPNLSSLRDMATASGFDVPVEIALHVAAEIAHALAHAHGARDDRGRPLGLVHRDVTPPNILVSWAGDVKLTDFGIAWAFRRSTATAVGRTKGKLGFMPPEQLEARDVDPRTDVFALGCVLHWFATGASPLIDQEIDAPFERKISAALPDDVRDIVERATRSNPNERYENAEAMAAELGRVLAPRLAVDARSVLLEWMAPLGAADTLFDRPDPETVEVIAVGATSDLLELETIAPGATEDQRPTKAIPANTEVSKNARAEPRRSSAPMLIAAVAFVLGVGVGLVAAPSTPAPASNEIAAGTRAAATQELDALSAALAKKAKQIAAAQQVEFEAELLELRLAAAKAEGDDDLRAVAVRARRLRLALGDTSP